MTRFSLSFFVLLMLGCVLILMAGCTQLPSGVWVPIWQDPARGFVPEPVEVPFSLTCRTFEDQSPFDTGTITRCEHAGMPVELVGMSG